MTDDTAPRMGVDPAQGPDRTVCLVELRVLTDFARQVLEMRRAQQQYFELRRSTPHSDHRQAYQYARQCERRVDAAARAALNRERESLPGMEEFSE